MSLQDYRHKRRFDRTREPAPEAAAVGEGRSIFVVQLHHARRRHYDVRLQVGDALKSWAVPKGPSFDPEVKRLAVEVEDHPVSYAEFEGDIPEGEYGAGHVDLFDRGYWSTPEDAERQIVKGHLRFELFGERLKGAWHLVRSGGSRDKPQWFLIKIQDRYAGKVEADDLLDEGPAGKAKRRSKQARRKNVPPAAKRGALAELAAAAAALPGSRKATLKHEPFEPQLATSKSRVPAGEDWLHEVKWDGYRLLCAIVGGRPRLWSRNAIEWTAKVPDIVQALADLGLRSARLDGELIAVADGRSDFGALQETLSGERQAPLAYALFDLPYLEGCDLSRCALAERKALLERVVARADAGGHLLYSTHHRGDGEAVFEAASAQGLEGILSKRAESPYRGGRGDDWVKIKRLESGEFAVIGYTPPRGARRGFGSLLLGTPAGKGWRYAGRVGTGFSDQLLRELSRRLTDGRRKPVVPVSGIDPTLRNALWLKPAIVVEVFHRGLGSQGVLRQPSLKAVRPDKGIGDLRPARADPNEAPAAFADVKITHPARIVYEQPKTTKQSVVDYYAAVMDALLPEVAGRPLSIVRCPDGVEKPCFFQKHFIAGLKHVGTARLKEISGSGANYLYVETAASVLELVQFGALEFHPWGSTVADPERADRIVFDLDPGEEVGWQRVVAAARLLRRLLESVDLASFLRVSGGKGLHVVVPLNPGCEWRLVKSFAQGFAETLAAMHPLEFVATASKRFRRGKIFVDYLRNARGATSVASYSLRARPGAHVAMPIAWSELGRVGSSQAFDIDSARQRLARRRTDPWEGIDALRQDLDKVGELLSEQ